MAQRTLKSYNLGSSIPRDDNGRKLVIIQREGLRRVTNLNGLAAELKAWGFGPLSPRPVVPYTRRP